MQDLREVTKYAREHQQDFLDAVKKRSTREIEKLQTENRAELDKSVRRMREIDVIIQKLYEDNISGKINDERFEKSSATYESEQEKLQETIKQLQKEISAVRDEGESVERFIRLVNK